METDRESGWAIGWHRADEKCVRRQYGTRRQDARVTIREEIEEEEEKMDFYLFSACLSSLFSFEFYSPTFRPRPTAIFLLVYLLSV